jgi:predicted nuclease of predicted toxin-antitoxin system
MKVLIDAQLPRRLAAQFDKQDLRRFTLLTFPV